METQMEPQSAIQVEPLSFDEAMRAAGREYILNVLKKANWKVSEAARIARRNRSDFYKLIERYGLMEQFNKHKRPVKRGNALWQALGH